MTRRVVFILLCLMIYLTPGLAQAEVERRDPFGLDYSDEIVEVHPGDVFSFDVEFRIPQNYFLYSDKTSVLFTQTQDLNLLKTERPKAEAHYDKFFDKTVQAYFHDFQIKVYLQVPKTLTPGRRLLEALIQYQGCSDDFCYKPVRRKILLPVQVVPLGASIAAQVSASSPPLAPTKTASEKISFWNLLSETHAETLLNLSKPVLLALALLAGLLTCLTPCVLPLIPLTLAFIGVRHRRRSNFFRAAILVLGMVVMYATLGFLAASLGLKLGFLFQSRIFVLAVALAFLISGLGMFGVIPFHLPSRWQKRLVQTGSDSPVGIFLVGLTLGFIASPCVGPLLGPLLLIAAREQDRLFGFILLFHYGLGMGLPFVLLGLLYGELQSHLRSGAWSRWLKYGLGLLLFLPAFYYGYSFAKPYLGQQKDALWIYSFTQGLDLARAQQKPILIDFYADWCPPCLELDQRTFSAAEVRELAKAFVMIKIDCTTEDSNCQLATQRYHVVGWPTVLFLDPRGEPFAGIQLVGGFADKTRMLELMRLALQRIKEHP